MDVLAAAVAEGVMLFLFKMEPWMTGRRQRKSSFCQAGIFGREGDIVS